EPIKPAVRPAVDVNRAADDERRPEVLPLRSERRRPPNAARDRVERPQLRLPAYPLVRLQVHDAVDDRGVTDAVDLAEVVPPELRPVRDAQGDERIDRIERSLVRDEDARSIARDGMQRIRAAYRHRPGGDRRRTRAVDGIHARVLRVASEHR